MHFLKDEIDRYYVHIIYFIFLGILKKKDVMLMDGPSVWQGLKRQLRLDRHQWHCSIACCCFYC